ncbi:hypothetical protein ACLMJK_003839 [Lecanora helva]
MIDWSVGIMLGKSDLNLINRWFGNCLNHPHWASLNQSSSYISRNPIIIDVEIKGLSDLDPRIQLAVWAQARYKKRVFHGWDPTIPMPAIIIDRHTWEGYLFFGIDKEVPKVPVAKLSVLRDRAKPRSDARSALRVGEDGEFKIVQISDTHMVTGVGIYKDTVDAFGNHLPESETDPLTIKFIEKVLDVEKADLVVLAGDQLHHDIPDSQSALFKVVAPIIERLIPFAAVFGNHDSEGINALPQFDNTL